MGYLAVDPIFDRYTHRVAISNHRLLTFEQERVTFRWKDYAHGGKPGKMTPGRHGVLTALLSARTPQGVRTHPSLRISRESHARFSFGAVPTTSELHFPWVRRNCNLPNSLREFYPLALPALRCSHDRDSKIYRRGTINMCLLRFFVALSSVALSSRAPARRSIRVFTPC
jgi:hypothetical protein